MKLKMKSKIIIFVFLFCFVTFILLNFFSKEHNGSNMDEFQREFVKTSGFLTEENNGTNAISKYAEAIKILYSNNADKIDFNQPSEQYDIGKDINLPVLNKIYEVFISGAKQENLGLFTYYEFRITIDIPDYGSFKLLEFIFLQKVMERIAESKLYIEDDLDKSLILTKANIAMGIQFAEQDYKTLRMTGLSGKEKGLRMLEYYLRQKHDDIELQKSIDNIRKELNEETEQVRKMKNPEPPSFWYYFFH